MGQGDRISILLVEDDAAARANIAAILIGAGMAVEQVADGAANGETRAGIIIIRALQRGLHIINY